MPEPTHTAVGTWSGGRFMHFGEPLDDDRLAALLRPGDGDRARCITADAYGAGEADRLLGRALRGRAARRLLRWSARSGTTSTTGEREGAKGFPRFTDPRLRGPDELRRLPAHGDRALARAHAAPTPSTCCCCTTPTAPATRARRSGTGMAAVRDAGLTARARRRARAPPTASRST